MRLLWLSRWLYLLLCFMGSPNLKVGQDPEGRGGAGAGGVRLSS